jgi:hypothetical protein
VEQRGTTLELTFDQIKILDRISEWVNPERIQITQGRVGEIYAMVPGRIWKIYPGGPFEEYTERGGAS